MLIRNNKRSKRLLNNTCFRFYTCACRQWEYCDSKIRRLRIISKIALLETKKWENRKWYIIFFLIDASSSEQDEIEKFAYTAVFLFKIQSSLLRNLSFKDEEFYHICFIIWDIFRYRSSSNYEGSVEINDSNNYASRIP